MAKLMGYEFEIEYKPGSLNKAADALSRRSEDATLAAISIPYWAQWDSLDAELFVDAEYQQLKEKIMAAPNSFPRHKVIQGRAFFNGKLLLPSNSKWIPLLLSEFHSSPQGGHSGALRTYKRIAANFHWTGIMKKVQDFVASCDVCQKNKTDTLAPAGLLQSLPIPKVVWEDVSMDFISGLPRSNSFNCILVVVDRLSKYGHFVGLKHPFTAKSVADVFSKEIVKLNGVPRSIVNDRDLLFMSSFWKEFFQGWGTKLKMSKAYHPEKTGQTEVLNRCLETYIRCFSSE